MTELTLLSVQAETTEVFHMHNNSSEHGDLDRAVLLRNCNGKLTQWMGVWETEMQRANGERFHMEFLKFFRLYVRLSIPQLLRYSGLASGVPPIYLSSSQHVPSFVTDFEA